MSLEIDGELSRRPTVDLIRLLLDPLSLDFERVRDLAVVDERERHLTGLGELDHGRVEFEVGRRELDGASSAATGVAGRLVVAVVASAAREEDDAQ